MESSVVGLVNGLQFLYSTSWASDCSLWEPARDLLGDPRDNARMDVLSACLDDDHRPNREEATDRAMVAQLKDTALDLR